MARECKDCRAEHRPGPVLNAPYQGPRCYRHWHQWKTRSKARKAEQRVEVTYGISPEVYQALLTAQGGRCAWCGRKIGRTVRAAIDHDHSCQVCGGGGCPACVRGLLDRKCNEILGWFGDDPELIEAGAGYLRRPPAKGVLELSNRVRCAS